MALHKWEVLKTATLTLAKSLDSYLAYLNEQSKIMTLHHYSVPQPVVNNTTITIFAPNPLLAPQLRKLNDALKTKGPYEVVSVDEYTPADRKKRCRFNSRSTKMIM